MAERTRDDLIDVLRRTTDPNWLDPILDDPDAAAVVEATADLLAHLSHVAQVACDNTTISGASAGRGGTSVVTLSRTSTGTSGTIPAGYAFVDERGVVAVAVGDVTVASGAATVDVEVVTLRKTELVNTVEDPAFVVGPNGPVYDGGGTDALVGQDPAPAGYPPVVATTFTTVSAATPISEGASDWLAAVGRERGQLRQANESDEAFRLRVRNVPDAVSPVAVGQGVVGAVSHAALPPPYVLEPFNDEASTAARVAAQLDWFDCLYFSGTLDSSGNAGSDSPQTDFAEDIQPDLTNHKVRETVSLREARCYFRMSLSGPFPDPDGGRMFFDDSYFDDPVLGFPDVHDSSVLMTALMAVWEEANRKRAAGVRFDEYIEATERQTGVGSTDSNVEATVFTLTPPVGYEWVLMDGHFGWDAPTLPTSATARLRFTFTDASTYTTPADPDTWGRRVNGLDVYGTGPEVRRITQVEGLLTSDGVVTANLVGNLVLLQVAP